jgi:hypothetical protein
MVYAKVTRNKQQSFSGNSMARVPSGASVFETFVATAICVLIMFLAGGISIADLLPEPKVEEMDRSAAPPSQFVVPVQLSSGVDERQPAEEKSFDIIVVKERDVSSDPRAAAASGHEDPGGLDRGYLVETATPGWTMTLQGPEVAIARLHPEFVHRLAGAIREAKGAGLSAAGIFSAYRSPAFGIGGFSNKFNSLHTYGLAVDMTGIGGPGSADAKLWYEIAARHGVVCPYGVANHLEWNHCQPTRLKVITAQSPLRGTVTASGPVDLENMFQTGDSYIEGADEVLAAPISPSPAEGKKAASYPSEQTNSEGSILNANISRFSRESRTELVLHVHPSWCNHLHHPSIKACGTETAEKPPNVHPKQASSGIARHHI